MKYYSTKNPSLQYSLADAVLLGLPPDNGLFMPEEIPVLSPDFIRNLKGKSLVEIGQQIASAWFGSDIPEDVLLSLVADAFPFDTPLVQIDGSTSVLELFHGPTCAFKDVGARFMSRLMSWLELDSTKPLTILVATSGDTGSAVASGFFGVKGIEVIILYPSGKVSPLQEQQLTTWGGNITALEVKGSFDDCQLMVKQAFLDDSLKKKYRLSSANSINIARLVPQSFYYFRAVAQMELNNSPVTFIVPSGNFGNLTAGLLAKRMGLPVQRFIAATNANDVVPHYLETGNYYPRPSVMTYSNAMDVGAPSNFARMEQLYHGDVAAFRGEISGYAFNDASTLAMMANGLEKYNYLFDPHGAVGALAWNEYRKDHPNEHGIILETAHPAKFGEVVEKAIGKFPETPQRLEETLFKEKQSIRMEATYASLKSWLIGRS